MAQTAWQNTKIAILVLALLLAAKLEPGAGHHACATCAPEAVVPVLQEEADVVPQDDFKGKDA